MNYTVCALYRFTPLADAPAMQQALKAELAALDMCGILLVAPEGINGTLAGSEDAVRKMLDILKEKTGLNADENEIKFSTSKDKPFRKLRVRLKKEIITFKQAEADPSKRVGKYISPQEWDDLAQDPDVVLLDTRNDYETNLGIFKGAIDPNIKHFTHFADYVRNTLDPKKHKKIALYCTGGIRCEKASAFMLAEGFEEVYHLKGGILKYLEEIPPEKSSWQGDCFVFDRRVALGHGLAELQDSI
jgi:UPF0176 protein